MVFNHWKHIFPNPSLNNLVCNIQERCAKMTLTFHILGQPVAKGRPRISTRSGYPIAYTPQKTRNAEADLRSQIISQLPVTFRPLEGPIILAIHFYIQKPKSARKKDLYPTTRPDIDNYIKSVLDAMNTVVFYDDNQVVFLSASKEYGTPGITIVVDEPQLQPPQPQP